MDYQSPAKAAPNIQTLLDALSGMERGGKKYIYRGQTKEWPAPLFPSLFRKSVRLKREFTPRDREYKLSLRKCGKHYYEMEPDSFIKKLAMDNPSFRVPKSEYDMMTMLENDPKFSAQIATEGFEAALKSWVQPEFLPQVLMRSSIWKIFVDNYHQAVIRQIGFLQPFGYVLGQTLAQQYGFSSELLDFTSDIQVAGFFATHDSPRYMFEGSALIKRLGTDVGVIYRLPSTEGSLLHDRIDKHTFYTCPPQVHMSEVCMRFEDKSSPEMKEQYQKLELRDEDELSARYGGAEVLNEILGQLRGDVIASQVSAVAKSANVRMQEDEPVWHEWFQAPQNSGSRVPESVLYQSAASNPLAGVGEGKG